MGSEMPTPEQSEQEENNQSWTPEKLDDVKQRVDYLNAAKGGERAFWYNEFSPAKKAEINQRYKELMDLVPGESKTEKVQHLSDLLINFREIDEGHDDNSAGEGPRSWFYKNESDSDTANQEQAM